MNMIINLKKFWINTDWLVKDNYKYRTMSSIFCTSIILIHFYENDWPLSPLDVALIFATLCYPSVTFYVCARSKDPVEAALNATIVDLFWCGLLIASFHFSFAPSVILALVCITDFIAAKGLSKMHALLLIPLGFIPIVIIDGMNVNQGGGVAELIASSVYGMISLSILGYMTYRASNDLKNRNIILEESKKELAESNAVKDKLFSIIAHDIKSPLNSLKGFIYLLETKSLNASEQETLLQNLGNHFHHTTDLIDNVLQWARSQMNGMVMTKEVINIQVTAEKAVKLLQPQAQKKQITVTNNIPSCEALADPNMIELVFRNLIANAIKFTPPGGKITLACAISNGVATCCVEDNGIGILKDDIPRLFRLDKSFTTIGTEKEKGSGLGLALCKGFIEQHGGVLWLESEPGMGTRFYFTLQLT